VEICFLLGHRFENWSHRFIFVVLGYCVFCIVNVAELAKGLEVEEDACTPKIESLLPVLATNTEVPEGRNRTLSFTAVVFGNTEVGFPIAERLGLNVAKET
jgi:hypothetical protein